jgi:hypothetical protein
MLLNQNLVSVAAGVSVAVGSLGIALPLPKGCEEAIVSKSTEQVSAMCGLLASDAGMVVVILIGGVVLFFTTPIKDFVEQLVGLSKKE